MLTFITGKIDSGKTARMLEMYEKLKHEGADGFVCTKVFSGKDFKGYDLMRLGSPSRFQLAVLDVDYQGGFSKPVLFDRFVFNAECFLEGADILSEAISNASVKHVFIDEIGPLELRGEGFPGIIALLSDRSLLSRKDFYVCTRDSCLAPLLEAIGPTDSCIIRT